MIFTSVGTDVDDGYAVTAGRMIELAAQQPGFLGVESARDELGITVSYWESLPAIQNWKAEAEHRLAQESGRAKWYEQFTVRICRVERDYSFSRPVSASPGAP